MLVLALLCAGCGSKTDEPSPDASEQTPLTRTVSGCRALLGNKGSCLSDTEALPAGSSVSDWLALALRLSGADDAYEDYLSALRDSVTARCAESGALDARKATEYHRTALTVLALGGDPTQFGVKPDGTPVDLIADGVYAFAGDLSAQGLNAPIFALLTLDAGAFSVPDGANYDRETLVSTILAQQEESGGFGLIPGGTDVDITAMAICALAPYPQAEAAVARALTYLETEMTDSCGFLSYGTESAESTCQVIIALCALGIDPRSDARFTRGESNLLTGLERYRQADGSFSHALDDEEGNLMATEQALLALAAMERLAQGRRLYDFTAQE